MSEPPHVLTMADNFSRGAADGCDVKPPGWANIYCCCCLKSATVAADKTGVINRGANYKDWAVEFWAEDLRWFIFLLCCASKLRPRGRESFFSEFTFHIEWQILQIRSSRERCEVPRSIRVCRGFEKTLHRSVVMELDMEVKLLPPAIQAFMTELGGAIPEVFSSSPYIFPLLALLPTFSHRSCSPHNLTKWQSPSPRFCFTAYSAQKGGCYYTLCSTQAGRSCASGIRRKVGILSPYIRYFSRG